MIGIMGINGAGKTTTAQMFVSLGYKMINIADPLKDIAIVFGFKRSEVHGSQAEKEAASELWGISGRRFLEVFGTKIVREQFPQVLPSMSSPWLRIAMDKADSKTVIGDVRFPDEARAIKASGGFLIHIRRSGLEHKGELDPLTTCPAKPDFIIDNNGSLAELRVRVGEIARQIHQTLLDRADS